MECSCVERSGEEYAEALSEEYAEALSEE